MTGNLGEHDFVAVTEFPEEDTVRRGFPEAFARIARTGAPFVAFLAEAVDVDFGPGRADPGFIRRRESSP